MAKRVIQECDLTKAEYDPEETVVLVIKKKGKKAGRTYELSPDAAAILEQQLVAGSSAALKAGWGFANVVEAVTVHDHGGRRTLADLEVEDDAKFVAAKKSELREAGIIDEDREQPTEPVISKALGTSTIDNGCSHMNKGRIQTTLNDGKRFVYRTCTDCRTKIPEMTVEEKKAYMNSKAGPDVRVRDLTN